MTSKKDSFYVRMEDLGFFALEKRGEKTGETVLSAEKSVYLKVYRIFPGIEVYYNDYNTRLAFSGNFNGGSYHQIAYCHCGLYESRISPQRTIRLSNKELIAFSDISSCVESSLPLGYYKGINVMFYPEQFNGETSRLFKAFSIDIDKVFRRLTKEKVFCRFTCEPSLTQLLEELYAFAAEGDTLHMKLHLVRILAEIQHTDGVLEKEYRYLDKENLRLLEEIKAYIEENLAKRMTIRDLAEEFCISETALKKKFKNCYGCSPHEFLKQCRMRAASALLQNTDLSVAEIGVRVGYENPSKFAAAFSSVCRMTPRTFRKNT